MIKFIHKSQYDGTKIVHTIPDDVLISDVVAAFRNFLLGVTFQPGNIDEYIYNPDNSGAWLGDQDDDYGRDDVREFTWGDVPTSDDSESDDDVGCPGCKVDGTCTAPVPDDLPEEPMFGAVHENSLP